MIIVLYIFIIMCMRVLQSLFSKKAALVIPEGIRAYVFYVFLSNLFATGFSMLALIGARNFSGFNLQALIIATCSGLFLTLGSLCSIKALRGGTIVLNSIFSTAGLIIPCILGIFLFNEPLSVIQIFCIVAVLVSTVMLIDSSKKISGSFSLKTLLYLLCSMFSNGMVMFCQKLFGMLQPDGNVSLFSMLTFLIPSVVLVASLIFLPKEKTDTNPFPKKLVLYAVYLAFAVFIIQQLVTMLTPVLPSAVLFTLVNGGATVIAAIVGALMYKEKITIKSATGIVLGIAALVIIKTF